MVRTCPDCRTIYNWHRCPLCAVPMPPRMTDAELLEACARMEADAERDRVAWLREKQERHARRAAGSVGVVLRRIGKVLEARRRFCAVCRHLHHRCICGDLRAVRWFGDD